MKRIAIVPAFDESGAIGHVVDEIRTFDPGLDVLVVDDASAGRDRVGRRARGAYVVTLPFNLGIGGAVQTGFRFAAQHGYELRGCAWTATASTTGRVRASHRARLERCSRRLCRLALRRLGELPLVAHAPHRHPHPCEDGLAAHRPASHRHDERLPGPEPQAIELFAADYPHDYPEVEAA